MKATHAFIGALAFALMPLALISTVAYACVVLVLSIASGTIR